MHFLFPLSFWVQHHCRKYKYQDYYSLSDEVNVYVTLWSYLVPEIKCYEHLWLFLINNVCVFFLAVLLLCTNCFLTKPTGHQAANIQVICRHSVNIYAEQLIDGDCMENSRRRLQRWALDTVNIQSECIKKHYVERGKFGGWQGQEKVSRWQPVDQLQW